MSKNSKSFYVVTPDGKLHSTRHARYVFTHVVIARGADPAALWQVVGWKVSARTAIAEAERVEKVWAQVTILDSVTQIRPAGFIDERDVIPERFLPPLMVPAAMPDVPMVPPPPPPPPSRDD